MKNYDKHNGANKLYVSYAWLFSPTLTTCFSFVEFFLHDDQNYMHIDYESPMVQDNTPFIATS